MLKEIVKVLFVAALILPCGAFAHDYKLTATGWSVASAGADINGDGEPGFVGDEAGTGSFGKFTQQSVGDVVFIGAGTFCGDGELELAYVDVTSVLRAPNGDLLYRKLSNRGASGLCFNFITETFEFTAHLDVVGGTGRFEGATGTAIQSGMGTPFGVNSAIQTEEVGELFLPKGNAD